MTDFDKISISGTYYNVKDSAARNAVNDLNTQITTIRNDLNTQITTIRQEIKQLSAHNFKNCVFIGDSYIELTPSWGDALAGLLPGVQKHHNFGNGGGGYQTSGKNGTFQQMLSAGGSVYQAVQDYKNDVTFVIIEGGINDGQTTGDAQTSAVMAAVNAAKSLFPNAEISLVYNWFSHAYPEGQWRGILEGGAKAGALVCVESRIWLWSADPTQFFNSDLVHPNAAGTDFATRLLCRWLLSGSAGWSLPMQSITLTTGLWLLFEVNTQVITVHVYGQVNTPVNTVNLGTVPLCLRPYQRDVNCLWFDTNMTNSEIATRGPNRIKWGPNGQISTNGNPGGSAISSAATLVIPTDTLFNYTG